MLMFKIRVLVGMISAVIRWIRSGFTLFEFHRFNFDISRPLPEGSFGVMVRGCDLLSQYQANYRITDGSALGLYREGRFIPHDNDIDIDVLDCNNISSIIKAFLKRGFSIGRLVYFKGSIQQVVFFNNNDVLFDILFWRSSADLICNFSEPGYIRSQSIEYFLTKTTLVLDEIELTLPGKIEEWLTFRYGQDWRTPKTFKGDWKLECFDLSKIS